MDQKLVTYGKIFRLFGLHLFARVIHPPANIRVTYTHEVRDEHMENFHRIVRLLGHYRTFITPDEFISIYAKDKDKDKRLAGRFLLMTFDDGLLSSYRATIEVLDPYNVKAIFFIPTAILGLKTEYEMRTFAAKRIHCDSKVAELLSPDEFRFMTADHLLKLSSEGHMICPHTHNHVSLFDIRDRETVQRELIHPRRILEDILIRKIRAFSFPVGTEKEVGTLAYNFIRKIYDLCFTALNGVNSHGTDPYRLHRDCLPSEAPLSYVRMVMMGNYDLYYKIKMYRLKKRIEK